MTIDGGQYQYRDVVIQGREQAIPTIVSIDYGSGQSNVDSAGDLFASSSGTISMRRVEWLALLAALGYPPTSRYWRRRLAFRNRKRAR